MEIYINSLALTGTAEAVPELSHSNHGEKFFVFPLGVRRLSGQTDHINVVIAEEKLALVSPAARLHVTGQLRSYNNRSGKGSRLVITALARTIEADDTGEDSNEITLGGAICKAPTLRRTPLGRDICDVMLAVNRPYGRADYLPCIAWGAIAARVAERTVGKTLKLEGRVQSRRYSKATETGTEERTAFEVSVMRLIEPEDD